MFDFSKLYKIDIYYAMIFTLSILSIFSMLEFGFASTLPQILITVSSITATDLAINFVRYRNFRVPKSSIISGLFISMILSPSQPWYVLVFAALVVVVSKSFLRVKSRTLLNPASLALTLSLLVFSAPHAWWGTTSLIGIILLGIFIPLRLKRFDLVGSFFIVYLILSLSQTFFIGDFQNLQFKILDRATLFFMFFMLTEPMTTPVKQKGRIIYGSLAALLYFSLVNFYPANLLLALLVVNLLSPVLNAKL